MVEFLGIVGSLLGALMWFAFVAYSILAFERGDHDRAVHSALMSISFALASGLLS